MGKAEWAAGRGVLASIGASLLGPSTLVEATQSPRSKLDR